MRHAIFIHVRNGNDIMTTLDSAYNTKAQTLVKWARRAATRPLPLPHRPIT